jgi:inhibitor of cysteine peptidase
MKPINPKEETVMSQAQRVTKGILQLSLIFTLNNCGTFKKLMDSKDNFEIKDCPGAAEGAVATATCRPHPQKPHNSIGETFKTCEEFKSTLASNRKAQETARSEARTSSSKTFTAGSQKDAKTPNNFTPDIGTNLQESGVDEADTYKLSDTHIFAVQGHRLIVLDRTTKTLLGSLDQWLGMDPELYILKDTLIVVDLVAAADLGTARLSNPNTGIVPNDSNTSNSREQKTRVRFFKTQSGALPELQREQRFIGRRIETRLEKNRLVLISEDPFYGKDLSSIDNLERSKDLNCTRVLRPAINDFSESLTTLRSIPVVGGVTTELSVLGNTAFVYMSKGSLYLTQQITGATLSKSPVPPTNQLSAVRQLANSQDLTFIQGFKHQDDGTWGDMSSGFVVGRAKDKWALQQLGNAGEYLSVATTSGHLGGNGTNQAKNHLSVLKRQGAKLELKGSVPNFGLNEDIRSVRYLNKIAYIVTFKKTDPLFAISLINPEAPKMLGQLKIPGFSTYMQPLSETVMAGVGYDALEAGSNQDFAWFQGIQLSLFDISNPLAMNRLDNVVLGDRGSYSEATSNSHAFFYDPVEKIMSVPVTLLKNLEGKNGSWSTEPKPTFSGAIFYSVANNKLEELTRISHSSWLPSSCISVANRFRWWQNFGSEKTLDIARIFKVDGGYLSLSPFGLKSFPNGIRSDAPIQELEFSPGKSDFMCSQKPNGWCGTPD